MSSSEQDKVQRIMEEMGKGKEASARLFLGKDGRTLQTASDQNPNDKGLNITPEDMTVF